jgi:hypothetical protein
MTKSVPVNAKLNERNDHRILPTPRVPVCALRLWRGDWPSWPVQYAREAAVFVPPNGLIGTRSTRQCDTVDFQKATQIFLAPEPSFEIFFEHPYRDCPETYLG